MTENARMSTASVERDDAGSGLDMILGNMQGGDKNAVKHVEKFPVRLKFQRGESVEYVAKLIDSKN